MAADGGTCGCIGGAYELKLRSVMKTLCLSVVTAASVVAMAMPAAAVRQYSSAMKNCKVYDKGEMLTDEEESKINTLLQNTSDAVDMYVAMAVYGEDSGLINDYQCTVAADNLYDELFNLEPDLESDGLILQIDYATRAITISTCGMGELYYFNGVENDRCALMRENLMTTARNQDFVGMATQFCNDVVKYYNEGIPNNAYTYNSDDGLYRYQKHGEIVESESLPKTFGINWGPLIGTGLIIGFIVAMISFIVIQVRYRNKKALTPTAYTSGKDADYSVKDDLYLRTHTTRTLINDDSSRGGGGGGFGGGSSHSSGGGFSHGGGTSHF